MCMALPHASVPYPPHRDDEEPRELYTREVGVGRELVQSQLGHDVEPEHRVHCIHHTVYTTAGVQ